MPTRNHEYSEEAQEILGKIPSWIVRWGITVILVIFGGILICCYFIKYPDVVVAPISITTINPPSDLAARYTGLLDTVCIKNGQHVKKGQLLMLLSTPADYNDVVAIKQHLIASRDLLFSEMVSSPWADREYTLGELQSIYSQFEQKCTDFRHYLSANNITQKKMLLEEQISKNQQYFGRLKQQHNLLQKDLLYEIANQQRDSLLLQDAVISEIDYQTSVRNLIAKQNAKAGFEATMTSTELNIIQTKQQLIELSLQQNNEIATYERDLNQLRQQLLAQIAQWGEQYVITAPSDGSVSLMSYWSKNQRVSVGDILASVIPDGPTEIVGRMLVPSAGFGKVAMGQTVNVKLNGYPYMEFGVLKGIIRSVSAVPEMVQTSDGQSIVYITEAVFPIGLTTSYKRDLPMIQEMDGTGEIITEDMRLISRFFQPIVSLFKNR